MMLSAHVSRADDGVMRLQTALYALGQKHGDRALLVNTDGVVRPATVRAVQRALGMYVMQGSGVVPQNWLRGTSTSIIRASANDIARYIEQAAGVSPPSSAPAQTAAMVPSSEGAEMFPQQQSYYPPQPNYYPPGYAPRGPGGLPTNQASLDVKAFIPAQYDHIQLHPASGLAIVAVGVLLALVVSQHRAKAK